MNQAKRVVVTGATGNLGTSVVDALAADPDIGSITGIARRDADRTVSTFDLVPLDLATADDTRLDAVLAEADAVVHLAWSFQPTRDPATTWRINVLGALRVFESVVRCRVPVLAHASSVGTYSPGPAHEPVDESWPTHGWPSASYPREKAYLERVLDDLERRHPDLRVVRIRPAFVFQRAASAEQRRIFAGPLLPGRLARPGLIPVVPDVPGLRVQAVHADDVAEAFRLALRTPVSGAFNVAAAPPVDAAVLADLLGASTVRVPTSLVRAAVATAWRLHAIPASPELFDTVIRLPLMDVTRAERELGWRPRWSAREALSEFFEGLRDGSDDHRRNTPRLRSRIPGGRLREFATGVGGTT
ncbi:Nucleoside-diphosphate-sugar epimerase [Prauserella aidingensis]|uniref:NAD-dependent epimerase/dehydratase family protein n=1 Tax=Prauserella aidingensis TaxID=387890 RepID=UPI0020A5D4E4|nr:NAD-dependent epimerase/dehydratase family protein [Prauserella aidingensis]MCP2255516.1 Nucleoside-diphosphate-sugar epimerase [Prauserella aidingensis]